MSIVLIEKKGTVQNPRDGALLNHLACRQICAGYLTYYERYPNYFHHLIIYYKQYQIHQQFLLKYLLLFADPSIVKSPEGKLLIAVA